MGVVLGMQGSDMDGTLAPVGYPKTHRHEPTAAAGPGLACDRRESAKDPQLRSLLPDAVCCAVCVCACGTVLICSTFHLQRLLAYIGIRPTIMLANRVQGTLCQI